MFENDRSYLTEAAPLYRHFKMAANAVRRLGKMASETTAFFLCDMQEKFRPTIKYFPEIATVANRLVSVIDVSQEILLQ